FGVAFAVACCLWPRAYLFPVTCFLFPDVWFFPNVYLSRRAVDAACNTVAASHTVCKTCPGWAWISGKNLVFAFDLVLAIPCSLFPIPYFATIIFLMALLSETAGPSSLFKESILRTCRSLCG